MIYPHNSAIGVPLSVAREWMRRALDLLFPPHCVVCSHAGTWFCGACSANVQVVPEPICIRCGQPVTREGLCSRCRTNPLPLDGIRSAAVFGGSLRTAVHEFKYHGRRVLAPIFGEMMHQYWTHSGVSVDVVVPVPLHPSRKKERGFDQAYLLAVEFSIRSRLPLDYEHLLRMRSTAPQVSLGFAQRMANVANAFAWRGSGLGGRRILLIDDVCTTGATLAACASVLRSAGAGSVWALTLARPLNGN
jgi:ComF family protein